MAANTLKDRAFEVGTTGWTASDLDDPEVEALWCDGSYEILEGVLTVMPPAYFAGQGSLQNLIVSTSIFCREHAIKGGFASELDVVLSEDRVIRADAGWLSESDQQRQREAARAAGRADIDRTRILIPPTLIVESISPGHSRRDRIIKKRWYAEFGVPNYWILDAFEKSLDCFVFSGGEYQLDASAKDTGQVTPKLFPGLTIKLAELWTS